MLCTIIISNEGMSKRKPKYICERCSYATNHKGKYQCHLDRKIPCSPYAKHKNIIDNNYFICKTCDKEFASNQSLSRHNNTYHNTIKISGSNTGPITIGNNNNIFNNPIIIQPIISKYDKYDINDLTLYEQYLSLTSKESPYTAFLDHLNLNPTKEKYHNIKYKNIHKNIIDIYDGEKWIKGLVNNALSDVISAERIMIGLIFNRFRCFLNGKATKLIPKAYYYGYINNYRFHKKMVQQIKVHLYNNRNNNNTPNENISTDKNDDVWWAISKRFDWNNVNNYINKMDKYEIDFDGDLDNIKTNIQKLCDDKPKLKIFFKKLLVRIDRLICDFNDSRSSSTSSSYHDDDCNDIHNNND